MEQLKSLDKTEMIDSNKYYSANKLTTSHAAETCLEYFPKMLWRSDGQDTILDIGCGDGAVTEELLETLLPRDYKAIVAIDIDKEFIKRAQKRSTNEKIVYKTMDISGDIELELDKFDHITSFLCLHWVENQRKAFENIYNLLREGGDCLFTLSTNHSLHKAVKIMSLMGQWKHCFKGCNLDVAPFKFELNPEVNLRNTLMDIGFKHVEIESKLWTFAHGSVEAHRNFIKVFHPIGNRLNAEEYEKYIDDVLEVTRILDNQPSNCRIFRGNYITIYARK